MFKKGKIASISSLTSELMLNKKKESRNREFNSTTLSVRRPIINRAAKSNTRETGAYLLDVTITEEKENIYFNNKFENLIKLKETFDLSDEEEFV